MKGHYVKYQESSSKITINEADAIALYNPLADLFAQYKHSSFNVVIERGAE